MIGAATKKAAVSIAAVPARRALSTSHRALNVTRPGPEKPATAQPVKADLPKSNGSVQPPPPVQEAVKEHNAQEAKRTKRFSLFGFLFKAVLVSSVVYGGTLYAATKNDTVMDFVIDKDLPYHEELIDLIEHGSADDLHRAWEKIASKFTKKNLDQLTTQIEKQGGHLIEETKNMFHQDKEKSEQHPLPAVQLQKPVEFETSKGPLEKVPPVALKDGIASIADESVKQTIRSFNELLDLVDGSNLGPQKDAMVKKISENISLLSSKLAALNHSFETELKNKMKDTETRLLADQTQKELELTQNMLGQYNYEKIQLEKKYAARLAKEVEAAKQALSQAAVNATTMVRVEQTKRFEKMITKRVDEERNGRLKNLGAVNTRLEELEQLAVSLEKQVVSISSKSLIQRASSQLKSLLFNTTETTEAKNLTPYVESLTKATAKANDEVIALSLAELKPLLTQESNQSILTVPQLLTSWEQLAPELRSASLLPPNAGLLGHVASIFFSKLLLPVKGAKPEGRDIESVISRVESSLVRGELDVAVEEAANLKGWTRKLADDWVREGRKRLEAEFLIDLIDAEAKIL